MSVSAARSSDFLSMLMPRPDRHSDHIRHSRRSRGCVLLAQAVHACGNETVGGNPARSIEPPQERKQARNATKRTNVRTSDARNAQWTQQRRRLAASRCMTRATNDHMAIVCIACAVGKEVDCYAAILPVAARSGAVCQLFTCLSALCLRAAKPLLLAERRRRLRGGACEASISNNANGGCRRQRGGGVADVVVEQEQGLHAAAEGQRNVFQIARLSATSARIKGRGVARCVMPEAA